MSTLNEFESAFSSCMKKISSHEKLNDDEHLALMLRAPFYIQCSTGQDDPDLPQEREELELRAKKADSMIGNIERGVRMLCENVLARDPNPPLHVLQPLVRIQQNEHNAFRNKYAFRIAALDKQLSCYPIPKRAFFYMLAGAERRENGMVASFREADRTFFGAEDFSDESPIDSIIASHEAVHILENEAELSQITTMQQAHDFRAKQVFLAERKRAVLNPELSAYRTELQIANYAVDGALEHLDKASETTVMERLKAKQKDQQATIEVLLKLAKVFPGFQHHRPEQPFPRSFIAEIILLYRSWGAQICAEDASGRVHILG